MGGSQITGFLTILPIWSILVPSPWAITPLHLFAAKLITAKPTICAQQPAVAAPPAIPVSASDAHIAADDMGSVKQIPTTAETRAPISTGFNSTNIIIRLPRYFITALIPGPTSIDTPTPTAIVTVGVTIISTFVSL